MSRNDNDYWKAVQCRLMIPAKEGIIVEVICRDSSLLQTGAIQGPSYISTALHLFPILGVMDT